MRAVRELELELEMRLLDLGGAVLEPVVIQAALPDSDDVPG